MVALALGLAQGCGRVLPESWLPAVAGAVLVAFYGGIEVIAEALVEVGVIRPAAPVDWQALGWHLGLWDPLFLVWGLLLAVATWSNLKRLRSTDPPAGRAAGQG